MTSYSQKEFNTRNLLVLGFVSVGLAAGCAPDPKTMSGNYLDDPKYNTEECKDMRQKALDYNDRTLSRIGTGAALGLFLGPFGIPLAAGADVKQNEERKAWAREVHLACSSDPLPENLKN